GVDDLLPVEGARCRRHAHPSSLRDVADRYGLLRHARPSRCNRLHVTGCNTVTPDVNTRANRVESYAEGATVVAPSVRCVISEFRGKSWRRAVHGRPSSRTLRAM